VYSSAKEFHLALSHPTPRHKKKTARGRLPYYLHSQVFRDIALITSRRRPADRLHVAIVGQDGPSERVDVLQLEDARVVATIGLDRDDPSWNIHATVLQREVARVGQLGPDNLGIVG